MLALHRGKKLGVEKTKSPPHPSGCEAGFIAVTSFIAVLLQQESCQPEIGLK